MRASWLFLAVWLTISLSIVQCSDVKKQSGKDDGEDDIKNKVKDLLKKLDKAADDGDDDDDGDAKLQDDNVDIEPQPINFNYGTDDDDDDGPQPTDDKDEKPQPYNMNENDEGSESVDDDDDEPRTETDDDEPQPTVYSSLCGRPAVTPRASTKQARIVGGVEARRNSWPWQCSLRILSRGRYYHICGASVLSNRFVVTAAHCVVYSRTNTRVKPASLFRVVCGEHYLSLTERQQQTRRAYRIYRYPSYNGRTIDRDIALIQVTPYLTLNSYVRPVCLPSSYPPSGRSVTVTGWGRTQNTGSNNVLRQVAVPFIPRSLCNRYLGGNRVTAYMVCAGGVRNRGMCFGDSGGPLVWYTGGRYRLQGIVSWTLGRTCAQYRRPGVYVDVRRFNSWIRSITGVTPPGNIVPPPPPPPGGC